MGAKDLIQRTPQLQPSRGDKIQPRDFTELSRVVSELSSAISAAERPHISSRFLEKDDGTGDELALSSTALNGIVHGLGRAYRGWSLASLDAAAIVYEDTASDIDRTVYLPLRCTANVTVKLVVW